MQSRAEGPYLPSNVDFVAANNGLPDGAEAVRALVMAASYMVMGLGDVYLGAPCAVPVDPRCGAQGLAAPQDKGMSKHQMHMRRIIVLGACGRAHMMLM